MFIGAALGLMLHAHVEAVPAAITVSCAILGLVLVVTRDGWLSLFMAAVVVPDTNLLPLLCIVMLPARLLLAGKPCWPPTVTNPNPAQRGHYPRCGLPAPGHGTQ